MKRFLLTILVVATLTGVFAPVTASLSSGGLAVHTQTVLAASADEFITKDIKCGVGSLTSFIHCLNWVFYLIPYKLGGFFMHLSAWVFDSLAAASLSSAFYTSSSFIMDGWRITRDFSNIFFILILLYAALSLILDLEFGHANPKKMVASVVIIAIFINFSMFITGVIIDTSNTLALVFYNQINVVQSDKTDRVNNIVAPSSISEALVQAFQPQQLQTEEFWENLKHPVESKNIGKGALTGAAFGAIVPVIGPVIGATVGALAGVFITTTTNEVDGATMAAILIMVGLMYFAVAYSFFIASISFVGRLVSLWLAIIFAPFAFVTYIIPATQHIKGIGWTDWWKNLISVAFAAPIYFFFLYLISLMMKSSMVSPGIMQGNSKMGLVIIFISFLFLITLVLKATSYVKEASGEIGGMVMKGLQVVGGAATGVALGGIAFAASRTLGKKGDAFATDDTNKDVAAGRVSANSLLALKNKFGDGIWKGDTFQKFDEMSHDEIKGTTQFQALQRAGERKMKTAQFMANSSFDLRQTTAGATLANFTGMNLTGGIGGLSTDKRAGGWRGEANRKAAKSQEFAKSLGNIHAQQDAFDDTIANREETVEAEDASLRIITASANISSKEYTKAKDAIKELQDAIENAPNIDIAEAEQLAKKLQTAKDAAKKKDEESNAAVKAQHQKINDLRGGAKEAFFQDVKFADWMTYQSIDANGNIQGTKKNKIPTEFIDVHGNKVKVTADMIGPNKKMPFQQYQDWQTKASYDMKTGEPIYQKNADGSVKTDAAGKPIFEKTKKADGTEVTQQDTQTKVTPEAVQKTRYSTTEIGKTKKADGTLVTENDVVMGIRRDEARGIAELKAMKSRNEKDHMKSYAHMKMLQTGYKVKGATFDEYGQIKKMGHLHPPDTTDSARGWGVNIKEVLGTHRKDGIKEGAIAFADQLTESLRTFGVLGTIRETVKTTVNNSTINNTVFNSNSMRVKAAQAASDFNHEPHVPHAKAPKAAGFAGLLSGLFGGGGGGGGGGHSGGHDGGHGGGH